MGAAHDYQSLQRGVFRISVVSGTDTRLVRLNPSGHATRQRPSNLVCVRFPSAIVAGTVWLFVFWLPLSISGVRYPARPATGWRGVWVAGRDQSAHPN
jgi:hypothetical protein